MAQKEAGEPAVCRDRSVVTESVTGQTVQERLHPAQAAQRRPQPGCLWRPRGDERKCPRVGQRDAPYPVSEALEVVLPSVLRRLEHVLVEIHLVDDRLDDSVQECLSTWHVPVERHSLDAEF